MSKIKLEYIYDIILRNIPITKNILLYYGYSEEDINTLVEEGFLIQKNTNEYQLYSNYELYHYGLRALSLKQYMTANSCFIKCAQLEPNNRDFALQLFLKYIKHEEYQNAFVQFSIVEKIDSEKYKEENNLFLYLLSILTTCKKSYQERLENLDYDSIMLPPNSKEYYKDKINIVSQYVFKAQYRKGLEILNGIIKNDEYSTVNIEVLKELVNKVMVYEKGNKLSILAFAKDRRYQSIASTLKTKSKTIYLSNMETYIYLVASAIVEIKTTRIIPTPTITNTDDIYEAIKGNNYVLAKELNNIFMQKFNSPLDNQILDVLLTDINKLINKIQAQESEETKEEKTEKEYLKELEELAYYCLENNISLDEATEKYNLTLEQILLIKLIYARNYYVEEMYLLGDNLVKEVQRTKNKSTIVVSFLNKVNINKKFYKNRKEKYVRQRKLT